MRTDLALNVAESQKVFHIGSEEKMLTIHALDVSNLAFGSIDLSDISQLF